MPSGPAGSPAPGHTRASPALTADAYRQVVDQLDDAVAAIGLDGHYLEQNRLHHELLGFPDEELRGATPAIHLGEEAFARVASALAATGRFAGDVVSTTKDGRRLQLHLHAFTIEDSDGRPLCYVGIQRDVERAALAEDRLERSISLLEATLDSTADGLLVVDHAGRIVRYNAQFAAMWQLPPEVLAACEDDRALAHAVTLVREPDAFMERVRELYGRPDETSFDLIELEDGRVFERYSRPQLLNQETVGRVWSFRDVTGRAQSEAAVRESERRYRDLFEESRQAIYLTTRDGSLIAANPAALRLFGVEAGELEGLNARDLYVDPDERRSFQVEVERSGMVSDFPVRLRSLDGQEMDCVLTSTVRRDPEGEVIGYQGIVEDVTGRLRTERALRASEEKFRSLIEHASDTITLLDADGTITYESPSLERALGYRPEDLIGRNVFEFVHPEDVAESTARFKELLARPDQVVTVEVRFLHKDGSWRILDVIGRNLLHHEPVGAVIVNARDVTERKRIEARLLHDAFHDRLTQLPNRSLFIDRVGLLLQRGQRDQADRFSVLFLDLDRFKVVNDSLGHMIGDQLLVALAERLKTVIRPGDTVARIGGDEFTLLLDGVEGREAAGIADRVAEVLRDPFELGQHQVYASASIGIATSSAEYARAEEILRDADLAMYRAKEAGRSRYAVFDESMRADALAQLRLETTLRTALERSEFEVYYQPIIDLEAGRLYGFEALLRWRHPERGLVAPAEFLDIAEDTGLIVPIGWWVLETVCEQLSAWARAADGDPSPTVQVNVSALQLGRPELLHRVSDALGLFDTQPHLLHLELTESTMMEKAESTVATLNELKELGVGLSIDDFGTGYSSLGYLHRFPTDSVKIDRSFVRRMNLHGRGSEIVRTIVDLAHDLGMNVVAEGIETEAHVALLRGMRCNYGQGFYYAAPLPVGQATDLIRSRSSW